MTHPLLLCEPRELCKFEEKVTNRPMKIPSSPGGNAIPWRSRSNPRFTWEAEVDGATFENARREESHRVEVFVTDDRAPRHAVTRSSGWKTAGA